MAKKLSFKWQIGICCIVATILLAILFTLFFTSTISIINFLMLLAVIVLMLVCAISVLLIIRKKQQIELLRIKKIEIAERDRKLKDIYTILGLEIQYNEDGSVKDIFSLLRLTPKFDKDGKRILTPYELLKINPRFDENGNELPNVFIIKNRVSKVTKNIAEAPSFTFKPKQKEVSVPQEKQDKAPNAKPKQEKKNKAKPVLVQTNIKAGKSKNKPAGHEGFKATKSASNVNEQPKIKLSIPKLIPKIVQVFPEQNKNKNENNKDKQEIKANFKKEANNAHNNETNQQFGRVRPAHNPQVAQRLGCSTFVLKTIYVEKATKAQESFLFIEEMEKGI